MAKFIATDRIYQALFDAGVISAEPSSVRRCVIDLNHGEPARVYLETFADEALFDVELLGGLIVKTDLKVVEP